MSKEETTKPWSPNDSPRSEAKTNLAVIDTRRPQQERRPLSSRIKAAPRMMDLYRGL
jgi:hypothetical protein